jgi:hypothetical protein
LSARPLGTVSLVNLGKRVGVAAVKGEKVLELANARQAALGRKALTKRRLEDLVYEDVVTGPALVGSDREWPKASLAETNLALDYRAGGFGRNDGLRAQWWLEGRDFPLHLIREPVISEFGRARNLALRWVSSTHGLRRDKSLTEYRKLALLRQLGPVDGRFAQHGVSFGPAVYLLAYELMRFGERITPVSEDDAVASLFQDFTHTNGVHALAWLLEDPDAEHSAFRALTSLSDQEWFECRCATQCLQAVAITIANFLSSPGGQSDRQFSTAIAGSFERSPWLIFTFGAIANSMWNSKLPAAT